MLSDKNTHLDWMSTMVNDLKEKLIFALKLKGDKNQAVEYVKEYSCAGNRAWEIALKELNWS